jgi:Mg-chelatase subunit ChlD
VRSALLAGLFACSALLALILLVAFDEPLDVSVWGEELTFLTPRAFALLAVLPLALFPPLLSLAQLSRLRVALSTLLRVCGLAAVSVALAQPVALDTSDRVSLLFLVDVSDSIDSTSLEAAGKRVRSAFDARGDNDVQLVTFAKAARVVAIPETGPVPLARHADGSESNLAAAMSYALALFPPGHLPKAILISDGRETHGDAAAVATRLAESAARMWTAAPEGAVPLEVGLTGIELPETLKAGTPFRLRVLIHATQDTRARLSVTQNGVLSGLDGTRDLALTAGDNSVELRSVAHVAGPVTYRAELSELLGDTFAQNNRFERKVDVRGQPRVLLVEAERERSAPFVAALRAAQLDVEVRGEHGAPRSPAELDGVSLYVLSNVSADALSDAAISTIERYMQSGGAFLMAGGDKGFGLGGYRNSRLEPLLPVRLDTERRRDQPTLALYLVIDKSGSMNGPKIELAKEAARATAELLGPDDYLGVIGFDAQPLRVVRLQTAENRLALTRGIGKLAAGGGTAIFPALDAAYADLSAVRARLKHVILLTDGQTQENGLETLVQSMHVDAITVSTIGLGEDVNRSLLEQLARLGAGRAHFTSDPHNIPRLFMRETHAVARSAAVEDYVAVRVRTPADFLAGVDIERAPYLRGYVATRARPAPAQVILESDVGEPLLARMRVGLGWSLAWTSDLTPRWSSEWLRFSELPKLWGQLVREHMPADSDEVVPIRTEQRGDVLFAWLDALDARERFIHGLTGDLVVRPSTGDPLTAALSEVAPGRYEARLRLPVLGSFTLEAVLRRAGRTEIVGRGSHSHSFPAEYAAGGADHGLLARLAAATGGGPAPSGEALFAAESRLSPTKQPRFAPFLWLALACFLTDLAVRRWRPQGPNPK